MIFQIKLKYREKKAAAARNLLACATAPYSAKQAQAAYEALLKEARTGIPLNKSTFYEIEKTASDGVMLPHLKMI